MNQRIPCYVKRFSCNDKHKESTPDVCLDNVELSACSVAVVLFIPLNKSNLSKMNHNNKQAKFASVKKANKKLVVTIKKFSC